MRSIPDTCRPRGPAPAAIRVCGAALLLVLAAGCVERDAGRAVDEAVAEGRPADTQVIDAAGQGSNVPSFTVRRQGRPIQVQFYIAADDVQRVVVTSRSGRGLDRADGRTAYDAAYEAAQQIDCGGGRPVLVDPDSATYQDEDRRTALTQGAPAWVFRGRCG